MDTLQDITLFTESGVWYYHSKDVRAYGSIEALMESDILQGVPNREKSLTQLWEAANMADETPADEAGGFETEHTTATDADNPKTDEPENEA